MASTSIGVTTSFPFFSCNPNQTALFSVNPGVPAEDALQMVQCFLDDALVAMNQGEEVNFAAHRLVTLAKSALDATVKGLPESQPADPAAAEQPSGNTRHFDPNEIACGLNTIGSLASRCLESGEGTVNHDLIWSIIKIAEQFERQIASVRVSHE